MVAHVSRSTRFRLLPKSIQTTARMTTTATCRPIRDATHLRKVIRRCVNRRYGPCATMRTISNETHNNHSAAPSIPAKIGLARWISDLTRVRMYRLAQRPHDAIAGEMLSNIGKGRSADDARLALRYACCVSYRWIAQVRANGIASLRAETAARSRDGCVSPDAASFVD